MTENMKWAFISGLVGAAIGVTGTITVDRYLWPPVSSGISANSIHQIGILDLDKIWNEKSKSFVSRGLSNERLRKEMAMYVVTTGFVLDKLPKDLVLLSPGAINYANLKDYTEEIKLKIENYKSSYKEFSDKPTARKKK